MVLKKNNPHQGEIWLFNPDPVIGTEIGKKMRPGLIISCNAMNHGPSGLLIIVPLTSKEKGIPTHIRIEPHDANIPCTSFIVCEQIRCISKERLIKRMGYLKNHSLLREVTAWISDLLWIDL